MRVRRAIDVARDLDAAYAIVSEYFDAIAHPAALRDDRATLRAAYLVPPGALWLAEERSGEMIGCIAFRPLPALGVHACEVKRLYVRPSSRGTGVADALLDELEAHAVAAGYRMAYLDSKRELRTALRFYRRRGYRVCARYNDNPEANVFMRRALV